MSHQDPYAAAEARYFAACAVLATPPFDPGAPSAEAYEAAERERAAAVADMEHWSAPRRPVQQAAPDYADEGYRLRGGRLRHKEDEE